MMPILVGPARSVDRAEKSVRLARRFDRYGVRSGSVVLAQSFGLRWG
jgi:hypothetical protein